MTDDEIIELWAQANKLAGIKHPHTFDELKEFAQLISDKVKEQTLISNNRQWGLMVNKEREFIARMCENYCGAWDDQGYALASAIRARSNT